MTVRTPRSQSVKYECDFSAPNRTITLSHSHSRSLPDKLFNYNFVFLDANNVVVVGADRKPLRHELLDKFAIMKEIYFFAIIILQRASSLIQFFCCKKMRIKI
jgi:hypothetical protein